MLADLALLKEIQTHCQRDFSYIPESVVVDRWKVPSRFIRDGGGDCEDFSIYLYDRLKTRHGIDPSSMRLARVRTGEQFKEAHIVLVVECDDGASYVLDNRMLVPIPLNEIHADHLGDWQMLLVWMFNEEGIWVKDRFIAGRYPPKWAEVMAKLY